MRPEGLFRHRLAQARMAAGLTQRELAARLGLSKSAVGNWESGKGTPDPDTLRELANVLGVTADYLVGRTDEIDGIPTKTVHSPESSSEPVTIAALANPPPPGTDPEEWYRQAQARLEELKAEARRIAREAELAERHLRRARWRSGPSQN